MMVRFNTLQPLILALLMLVACKQGARRFIGKAADTKFTNPLLISGPDPWVEQNEDWYYVTHTTGKDLRLYRTKKMSELAHAEEKTIWTPPPSGMNSKQIWAPEIHFLDGKWYFYYAADDGNNDHHRIWVLENEGDPFDGNWVDKGELQLPGHKWAIDGTAFELNGQLYFLWSGWEGDVNTRQVIYLTKMSDPFTPEGDRVLLSAPELSWESRGGSPAVNEAPEFLQHGDKVFIIYSASGCWTDDYALGMLWASSSSDITDPGSWTKSENPVFVKNPSSNAYGPGHNGFFSSPDGTEDWILYHANPQSGQGCSNTRSPRMQKFTWTSDGFPSFGQPVALGKAMDPPSGENQ